eukprot:2379083-Rhodomonas_salina.1
MKQRSFFVVPQNFDPMRGFSQRADIPPVSVRMLAARAGRNAGAHLTDPRATLEAPILSTLPRAAAPKKLDFCIMAGSIPKFFELKSNTQLPLGMCERRSCGGEVSTCRHKMTSPALPKFARNWDSTNPLALAGPTDARVCTRFRRMFEAELRSFRVVELNATGIVNGTDCHKVTVTDHTSRHGPGTA